MGVWRPHARLHLTLLVRHLPIVWLPQLQQDRITRKVSVNCLILKIVMLYRVIITSCISILLHPMSSSPTMFIVSRVFLLGMLSWSNTSCSNVYHETFMSSQPHCMAPFPNVASSQLTESPRAKDSGVVLMPYFNITQQLLQNPSSVRARRHLSYQHTIQRTFNYLPSRFNPEIAKT